MILKKILVMNKKKIFPYMHIIWIFFEDIKRSKETYKIKTTRNFYNTFKNFYTVYLLT